ncbi:MAG: hypothetical protein ACE1ZE_02360, partial [Candidatus Binatia bacterium]
MPYIRYSQWTGTGAPSYSAEHIFEGLNEHLNNTGDLQQAMRRLIQRGMGEGEERVKGTRLCGRPRWATTWSKCW